VNVSVALLSWRVQHPQVAVTEARSIKELAASSDKAGGSEALFELCALVWQVRDDDAMSPKTVAEPQDEHVVAHIKVRRP